MKVKLSLRELFADSSIAGIARKIDLSETHDYDPDCILFNSSPVRRFIFYIPPIVGLPVGLDALFNDMNDYNSYGMKYTVNEDFIEFCVRTIKRLAANAEYISLIGYSAGGNIAFEITRKLELMGLKIDLLLLIDSGFKSDTSEKLNLNDTEIEMQIRWLVESRETSHFFRGSEVHLAEIMRSYIPYMNNLCNAGEINARIINYLAEANEYKSNRWIWREHTSSEFKTIAGEGRHSDLFVPRNLSVNISRLRNIYEMEYNEVLF